MCQIRQWAIRRERPQRESWSIFGRGSFCSECPSCPRRAGFMTARGLIWGAKLLYSRIWSGHCFFTEKSLENHQFRPSGAVTLSCTLLIRPNARTGSL